MDSIDSRLTNVETELKRIKDSEITDLRNQDRKLDQKIEDYFNRIDQKIDSNFQSQKESSDNVRNSLDVVKEGQFEQKIVNKEISLTLERFNDELTAHKKERDESRKEIKSQRRWVIGIAVPLIGSFVIAVIQMLF
ncbi:DUF2951 family protein [Staphylococcus sp. 50Mo3-1]|mgnify:CR=1 FL=1|uniref:DUF2951 family protein n=1 Tax=Staphylococcus sp. 50Mo3-2 TaxID=3135642 RepID=UPI0033D26352